MPAPQLHAKQVFTTPVACNDNILIQKAKPALITSVLSTMVTLGFMGIGFIAFGAIMTTGMIAWLISDKRTPQGLPVRRRSF